MLNSVFPDLQLARQSSPHDVAGNVNVVDFQGMGFCNSHGVILSAVPVCSLLGQGRALAERSQT
jgi:hypothetical protein